MELCFPLHERFEQLDIAIEPACAMESSEERSDEICYVVNMDQCRPKLTASPSFLEPVL